MDGSALLLPIEVTDWLCASTAGVAAAREPGVESRWLLESPDASLFQSAAPGQVVLSRALSSVPESRSKSVGPCPRNVGLILGD